MAWLKPKHSLFGARSSPKKNVLAPAVGELLPLGDALTDIQSINQSINQTHKQTNPHPKIVKDPNQLRAMLNCSHSQWFDRSDSIPDCDPRC